MLDELGRHVLGKAGSFVFTDSDAIRDVLSKHLPPAGGDDGEPDAAPARKASKNSRSRERKG